MRKTSDVTDTEFPFAEDSTPFILVYGEPAGRPEDVVDRDSQTKDGRGFEHASTYEKKVALVEQAIEIRDNGLVSVEASLLAVWPGARRSDVFLVDDLEEALGAMVR